MTFDKCRYPTDWKTISKRIRFERAGGKCEQCSAPHGFHIVRKIADPYQWCLMTDDEELYWHTEEYFDRATKVVLTVHHIGVDKPDGSTGSPHDKMDCRDENLIALCARCHLLADLDSHVANRRITLLKKKEAAIEAVGQLRLFQ